MMAIASLRRFRRKRDRLQARLFGQDPRDVFDDAGVGILGLGGIEEGCGVFLHTRGGKWLSRTKAVSAVFRAVKAHPR